MPSTMEQFLSQTLTATFEELALICPDGKLSDTQSEAPVDIAVSVSFSGPLSGCLVLRASSDILPEIAENMMGANGVYSLSVQRDALGELANVICGNLLPKVGGAQSVFVLSAPHEHVNADALTRWSPVSRASIGVENGRVVAEMLLSDDCLNVLGLTVEAA